MSDANRVLLRYVKESTYGTTPTNPAMTEVRMTGESLKPRVGYTQSQELRADRQISDVVRNDLGAEGSVNGELSYKAFDDWFLAALCAASFSSVVTITGSFSCVASGNKITRASGSFVTDGVVAKQWIRVKGFSTNSAEFYVKVDSVAALELVVTGKVLVNEGPTGSVEIEMGGQAVNGTTETSFSLQKQFQDLSNEYAVYTGMEVSTLDITVDASQILTLAFGWLGQKEVSAAADFSGATNVAAPTNRVMNAIDHVLAVLEAQSTTSAGAYSITKASLKLDNKLRERKKVGLLGAESIGRGTFPLTGSLEAYYAAKTTIDKLLNDTESSLAFVFRDGAGNAYVFDMPRVKFTEGNRSAGGIDQDIVMPLNFQAFRHATEGITFRLARWDV